jgi:hypothetical protein
LALIIRNLVRNWKPCLKENKQNIVLFLPYDKALIASRLGMNRETFSRVLTIIQQYTGIKIKGSTVEIESMDKLVEFSCGSCSLTFPCDELKSN